MVIFALAFLFCASMWRIMYQAFINERQQYTC